jgi:hypothetical protein
VGELGRLKKVLRRRHANPLFYVEKKISSVWVRNYFDGAIKSKHLIRQ